MPHRLTSHFELPADKNADFTIDPKDKQYGKQYANLYWLRLVVLRKRVEERARKRWSNLPGSSAPPKLVKRMLDVENGKLCYILGTVYMDMPLKPNVLEDLAREHYIAAPPPRRKFCSQNDEVMLEDESGRVRLVGKGIADAAGTFVTGTIMAALGAETPSGDFEVLEFCFAGLPPQADVKPVSSAQANGKGKEEDGEWVALLSGLEMGSGNAEQEARCMMLAEWLSGEVGGDEDREEAIKVSRVILAGNSLAQPDFTVSEEDKKPKRYGYDSSLYSAKPTTSLDAFLAELLPSIPIDLMPGENDPTAPTMPQQPLHPAMLPSADGFEGYEGRTNPWWCEVGGTSFLGTSGQPLDDIFKYLESEDRIGMAERTLEWSHISPTCPDTLWCYPFSDRDPFILPLTPHVYFIGNQPSFSTRVVTGDDGQTCRIVLLPKFSEKGEVVLVNTKSLEVRVQSFEL
ncbi:DNA polymerase alpha/epsilon subunit B-domain-containing protein [Leucosporidium creatinivorum]|uniref:DNA-directed DNA polymerase n=1 Tax=Leucosporidium creatinivorum TaxID=106004 RepID=A0A1Y2CA68_9BASI|nr:DNA polymerase alpha/epsilon subunit B-domain-containing protein [Leucosporidium creatinivorum]